jgi:hypothetical protein
MVRVITGDQADTPITHILTGIARSGGTATDAIGSGLSRSTTFGELSQVACRRKACRGTVAVASQSPAT